MSNWDDVWGKIIINPMCADSSQSVDNFLTGKSASDDVVPSSVELCSGTRVAFIASMESVMTYSDSPTPKSGAQHAYGTVIRVRTSSGDITESNHFVFVRWDDGEMRQIHRDHLRLAKHKSKQASSYRQRVSSLGDLSGFLRDSSDLVHTATKDIWSLKQDGDGYVIERLFDDSGEPLKGI